LKKLDYDELCKAVTSDPTLAEKFLRTAYPAGKVENGFFVLGDFKGAAGHSTVISIPDLRGKDRATDEACSGPIKILELLRGVTRAQAANQLKDWLHIEGVFVNGDSVSKNSISEYPWTSAVNALTGADWMELKRFRGYSDELIDRIRAKALVAKDNGKWCFPIYNQDGVIIGVDRLTAHPFFDVGKKAVWKPKPVGAARKKTWFSIGCEASHTKLLIVTESRWDALSILALYNDDELNEITIWAAVGTGQTEISFPDNAEVVLLAVQNDEPSKTWARAIAAQIGIQTLRQVFPPEEFNDFNEAFKVGKLSRESFDAGETFSLQSGKLTRDERRIYAAPGGPIQAPEAVKRAWEILASSGEVFNVCGVPMRLCIGKEREEVKADPTFNLLMQAFAKTFQVSKGKDGKLQWRQDLLSGSQIEIIIKSKGHNTLPPVSRVFQYPNLIRIGDSLMLPEKGYTPNAEGGPIFVLDNSDPLPEFISRPRFKH
jgi:hypothetical protein